MCNFVISYIFIVAQTASEFEARKKCSEMFIIHSFKIFYFYFYLFFEISFFLQYRQAFNMKFITKTILIITIIFISI